MTKSPVDHDHTGEDSARPARYSRLERIRAGEGGHPKIKMLERRRRKGQSDGTLIKQFLRIERGYLA